MFLSDCTFARHVRGAVLDMFPVLQECSAITFVERGYWEREASARR